MWVNTKGHGCSILWQKNIWFYKELSHYLPKWLYHFAFLSAKNESSCCSASSPVFGDVNILDFSHFNRCVVQSYHCFNL